MFPVGVHAPVAGDQISPRYQLRPAPFLLAAAYIALGLGLSVLWVKETQDHARHEAADHLDVNDDRRGGLGTRQVFSLVSWREPALSSASQAGMVNNLNDGLAWGLFPLLFATAGLSLTRIGVLAALYPAVWGLGQIVTGPMSDRYGRKPFIVAGMLLQAVALGIVAIGQSFAIWAAALVLLGAGTAMVYPTLLAAIGDVAHPTWRARAVGIYRLWRDGGFAVGALLAGFIADLAGIRAATWTVAAITAASGLFAAVRMYETHPSEQPQSVV
jgi:MFS family permease